MTHGMMSLVITKCELRTSHGETARQPGSRGLPFRKPPERLLGTINDSPLLWLGVCQTFREERVRRGENSLGNSPGASKLQVERRNARKKSVYLVTRDGWLRSRAALL